MQQVTPNLVLKQQILSPSFWVKIVGKSLTGYFCLDCLIKWQSSLLAVKLESSEGKTGGRTYIQAHLCGCWQVSIPLSSLPSLGATSWHGSWIPEGKKSKREW